MATQLEQARAGKITAEMEAVAVRDGMTPQQIRQGVEEGTIVVVAGNGRAGVATGIGRGLSTKVNASIGTSSDLLDVELELEKAAVAQKSGADTLMELSTAGDLDDIRRRVLAAVTLPVGNVPLTGTVHRPTR